MEDFDKNLHAERLHDANQCDGGSCPENKWNKKTKLVVEKMISRFVLMKMIFSDRTFIFGMIFGNIKICRKTGWTRSFLSFAQMLDFGKFRQHQNLITIMKKQFSKLTSASNITSDSFLKSLKPFPDTITDFILVKPERASQPQQQLLAKKLHCQKMFYSI